MLTLLTEQHRIKLLRLCSSYFPETKMNVYEFSDEYKNYCIHFKTVEHYFTGEQIIPDSPTLHMGMYQHSNTDHSIGYEQNIEIHWYELCVCELAKRMYNKDYLKKIIKMFESKQHIVDFLFNDYIEEYDLNITNHE